MIEGKNSKPVKALETVRLVEREANKVTKVGTSLSPKTKEEIIKFLKENLEVFTWSHKDVPGIPEVI